MNNPYESLKIYIVLNPVAEYIIIINSYFRNET